MPISEGRYQCLICEDIFEAKSGSFSKCKCGETEIEPSYFGYSYKNGNKGKEIESVRYYLEEEFVKLPDDIQVIYNEIKKIIEDTGYKYYLYEMTERGKNGEQYFSQINLEYNVAAEKYTSERNVLSLTIRLRKDDYKGDEITKKRLQRFLDFMKAVESKELDFTKRSKAIEFADNEDLRYYSEPTGDVNYNFYM